MAALTATTKVYTGMRIGDFVFAPRLLPTLAFVALLALLLTLGFWQLGRADEKWADLAARAEATRAPVVDLNATKTSLETHEFRRVRAEGEFDLNRQFLLDNQIKDQQVGYRIFTPLDLAGNDQWVLVDRGFVPIRGSRDVLPALPPPHGDADGAGVVTGRVSRGPSVGIKLGEPTDNPGVWPRRVQYMDFEYMGEALGVPVADYLLVEGSLATDVRLRRDGPDAWRFGPERHQGYAVQWFSLAAALTIIWLVVNTRRVAGKRSST